MPADATTIQLPPASTRSACVSGIRCRSPQVTVRTSIAYTGSVRCSAGGSRCRLTFDLYAPTARGPWPVAVVAPGGPVPPTGSGHLVEFATRLAGAGAIVLVANWRQGIPYGAPAPAPFRDLGCAIRTARAIAPALGGDGHVVLVGHSLGGWGAAVVALDPDGSAPDASCLATAGSARPDGFVGLAGAYAGPRGGLDDVDWVALLGSGLRRSDPVGLAGRSVARTIPTVLLHGTADRGVAPAQTAALAGALRLAGRPVRTSTLAGVTHMSILRMPATFGAIGIVLDALTPRR